MSTIDHAFFYNSIGGDRVYDADSFEHWLKKFFTSGVFAGDCQVTAGTGMSVSMAAGYANVDGKVRFFETAQTLQIATANATYDRIDTVVIERNDTDRDVTAKVVTGGYSSDPVAPAPVRENGVYQLVVAQIYVSAGATSITALDITDTRTSTDLCGVVTGAVEQYDFDQIMTQFNAWMQVQQQNFTAWFTGIQGQLSGDLAASLTLDVAALEEKTDSLENRADAVDEALGGCKIQVVTSLPGSPDAGTLYFVEDT